MCGGNYKSVEQILNWEIILKGANCKSSVEQIAKVCIKLLKCRAQCKNEKQMVKVWMKL